MPVESMTYDVVVVGAGNAGLCAALAAHGAGASVLILEKAPEAERGGDTAFTGGLFRFPFEGTTDVRALIPEYTDKELAAIDVGGYSEDDYRNDLERLSEGLADVELVRSLIEGAYPTMRWLTVSGGVRWMLATGRQSFRTDGDRYRFFGGLVVEAYGGGRGLSDQLFERAEQVGCTISYESKAVRLETDNNGALIGVEVASRKGRRSVRSHSVVLASGGFQANSEMRARYLGPDWELAKVRGTRFDTGDGLRMAIEIGARPYGHWSCCHAVAWDLMAPEVGDLDMGDLYQKHSYPLGIVVNRDGMRFIDEGADFRNFTYAKYGREILRQPQRRAFQIFDAKVIPLLRDEYRIKKATKARANSLKEIAELMLIDPLQLSKTVNDFNTHSDEGRWDPTILDGLASHPPGQPPKSNWAQKIDTAPFEAYAVTCGITFTFGGLRIDGGARVLDTEERPIPGLYAAGELVGGLFYFNYPGGAGLMAGAVFGRNAGVAAAQHAKDL